MGKIISSPVKRWPGAITLSDPLTFPQVIAIEKAIRSLNGKGSGTVGEIVANAEDAYKFLPALLLCIEKWELGGNFPKVVTADTFPSRPVASMYRLLTRLMAEVIDLYQETDDTDPKS